MLLRGSGIGTIKNYVQSRVLRWKFIDQLPGIPGKVFEFIMKLRDGLVVNVRFGKGLGFEPRQRPRLLD